MVCKNHGFFPLKIMLSLKTVDVVLKFVQETFLSLAASWWVYHYLCMWLLKWHWDRQAWMRVLILCICDNKEIFTAVCTYAGFTLDAFKRLSSYNCLDNSWLFLHCCPDLYFLDSNTINWQSNAGSFKTTLDFALGRYSQGITLYCSLWLLKIFDSHH